MGRIPKRNKKMTNVKAGGLGSIPLELIKNDGPNYWLTYLTLLKKYHNSKNCMDNLHIQGTKKML